MRNPHLLSDEWNKSVNSSSKADQSMAVPGMGINKKFKRKSREPKRLYSTSDFGQEEDSADETQEDPCKVGPAQRQAMLTQKPLSSITGLLPGQSGALDMRIGSNVPAITAKLSQLPVSQLHNLRSFPWPPISPPISQPQSNGNRLGSSPAFPSVTSTNSSHDHSSIRHPYPQEASFSGRLMGSQDRGEISAALSLPGVSQIRQNGYTVELQADSPEEPGSRKRLAIREDPSSGHVPEIKALQQTRRLLANARERTRVHTISAAFEALRKQVPCYSYGQKLSKLAILRIACNYILSLAQLAELDYTPDHTSLTFSQCVEQCTRTLQAEGRSKKRKE